MLVEEAAWVPKPATGGTSDCANAELRTPAAITRLNSGVKHRGDGAWGGESESESSPVRSTTMAGGDISSSSNDLARDRDADRFREEERARELAPSMGSELVPETVSPLKPTTGNTDRAASASCSTDDRVASAGV
jgi:hypothetical protein